MNCKLLLRRVVASALHRSGGLSVLSRRGLPWRVLMYHRITTPEEEGYPLQPGMYVSPQSFAAQMAFLAKRYRVVPLDELVQTLLHGEGVPEKTVAISFDDGWQDNYRHAFPVLRQHKLPATIFLATKYIGSNRTFWSDAIPYALSELRSRDAAQELLSRASKKHRLSQENFHKLSHCLECSKDSFIDELDATISAIKLEAAAKREGVAEALLAELKQQKPRSFLNWNEVKEMAEERISFGSHTHAHLPLAELKEMAIRMELENSFSQLRNAGITPAQTFCYPEGKFSEVSQRVLDSMSIEASLSVDTSSDLTTVPALIGRVGIHDDMTNTVSMFYSRLVF